MDLAKSAREILAMANISAGYNARQYGPWPQVNAEVQKEAQRMLKSLCTGREEPCIMK